MESFRSHVLRAIAPCPQVWKTDICRITLLMSASVLAINTILSQVLIGQDARTCDRAL